MRYYKSLFFIFLFLLIVQPIHAKKSSPILSWDDPRLGREGTFPGPTKEEIYSSYVESEFGITSTEAELLGVQLPSVMGHGYEETSEYLIGDVAVGLIFVQCTHELNSSCDEVWTAENITEVVNGIDGIEGIEDGLEWLEAQEPEAGATFLHFIENVSIDVKPTDYSPVDDEIWIQQTMEAMGYYGESVIYDYLNDLRGDYTTEWAFMIFIVLNDSFPPRPPGWIAWARVSHFVMTEGLNGQRYLRSHVTAHETAHVFGAQDEYFSLDYGCFGCFLSGYDNLMVPNLMCERACFPGYERDCVECVWGGECSGDSDCPAGELCDVDNRCSCTDDSDCVDYGPNYYCSYGKCKHKCMMQAAGIWNICPFAKAQIGWRDCDNDGTLDPIDTDGVCDSPPVSDTDDTGSGSKNYMEKGTCSGGCDFTTWSCNGGKTDYCIDDISLAEYYVDYKSDGCAQERKDCTEMGSDYFCHDGRCTSCIRDLNNDGEVGLVDLVIVALAYGSSDPVADLNDDGFVNQLDLDIVAAHYGEICA